MEKIAIIEIKTMSVKLQIYDVVRNKYFALAKTIDMPINLTKDFYNDNFIKPNIVKDINGILAVYKSIIESYECADVVCLATNAINEAKNANSYPSDEVFDFCRRSDALAPKSQYLDQRICLIQMGICCLQSVFGTVIYTLETKDALCSILSFSRIVCYIYIHRTDPSAFSAADAFLPVTFDADQRKITHRL